MTELLPRAKAKRDQIRKAAQQLFLEKGFVSSSMDAIAAEAGVSKQTLYSYYSGKEDLLIDVFRRIIHNFSQEFEVSNLTPCNREELQEALIYLAQKIIACLMQTEYLALVRLIISETPKFPQLGILFRSTVPERIMQHVSLLLEQAKTQGVVKIDKEEAVTRMFVGPLITYVLLDGLFAAESPPSRPNPKQIEEIVDLFMKTVVID
ncbi:TetR/AcrR family transcriptional regulator [Paenibacillus sp. KQZ6P-2]|uniref:TetR/AcrR family transcriptional regulator n=1 Tax=Paenibacillus mangrovi TaxID=2931978 RepID=A0A9X2B3A8_9BACL|nr:TetR/AcrR family transcriptional regulator [Paenibacillus mangrovi]MCJ8013454.1 TetR/AcrR family transcriptional regulator [Paenibacillus mangrovi]